MTISFLVCAADNAPLVSVLREAENRDYTLYRAPDLAAARAVMAAQVVHAVLLDGDWGEGVAHTWYQTLKQEPAWADLPLLLVCDPGRALDGFGATTGSGDAWLCSTLPRPLFKQQLCQWLDLRLALHQAAQQSNDARHVAFTALSSMGELGVVMSFLSRSFAATSLEAVADLAVDALQQYNLRGMIYTLWPKGRHVAATEQMPALDAMRMHIEQNRSKGRILERERIMMVNYNHVTVLVLDLPQDPEHLGRMRDNLATLAEGLDFRIDALLLEHENLIKEQMNQELRRIRRQLEQEIRERIQAHQALAAEKEEQQKLLEKLADTTSQLLQSEKLASIGQLAAGVAHEINNPIGFVSSNLGVLRRYMNDAFQILDLYQAADRLIPSGPEYRQIAAAKAAADLEFLRQDADDLVRDSIDGISRVRRIVQDLRDFSRQGDTSWEWADLHAGIDSTLNIVGNEVKYKAQVIKDYGPLPQVQCIMSQLNQVFMNLLVNAAQAISGQGTITIRSGCDADQVWLAFSDTGSGIAPEHLTHIFDPFFTTKPVGQGTGLGLAVSYGIIEKHGGVIEVDSIPGKGTTFRIRLPIKQPAQNPSEAGQDELQDIAMGSGQGI